MRGYSEDDRDAAISDPRWTIACGVAYDLWGLTDDQWNWCADERNRAERLSAAVKFLGLGASERDGTETFTEAPGDDPAEYTQACRFAYQLWREGQLEDPTGADIESFLAVDPGDRQWCDAHATRVSEAARLIALARAWTDEIAHRLILARGCRFAAGLALADSLPTASPVATPSDEPAGEFTVAILLTNQTRSELQISDVAADGDRSFSLPACAAMRINGERRTAPWSLAFASSAASSPLLLAERRSAEGGGALGLEIRFAADGSTAIREVSEPATVPATPAC
jgi:hypothetical protein